MKEKNITLSLFKAREWFNSNCKELKELALQVFSEKELTTFTYQDITSFEDAMNALGYFESVKRTYESYIQDLDRATAAMLKLNIVRKALNLENNIEFTKGDIWSPYHILVPTSSAYYKNKIKDSTLSIVGTLIQNGNKYKLLGGNADYSAYSGLTNFNPYNNHDICYLYANTGFLGCATKEIAKHFGKYFAKEIFDAKYGNFIEYQWL